jgi:hypothetical protein
VVVTEGAPSTASAVVTSSAHDFIAWGTKRRPWRGCCTVAGESSRAERFLDALNII